MHSISNFFFQTKIIRDPLAINISQIRLNFLASLSIGNEVVLKLRKLYILEFVGFLFFGNTFGQIEMLCLCICALTTC